jgi:hypothetical protein
VNALREQVFDDALLLGGGPVSRDPEFDFNAGNLCGGFLSSFAGDDPKIGSVIGNESELVLAAGASAIGAVGWRSGGLATGQDQGAKQRAYEAER